MKCKPRFIILVGDMHVFNFYYTYLIRLTVGFFFRISPIVVVN